MKHVIKVVLSSCDYVNVNHIHETPGLEISGCPSTDSAPGTGIFEARCPAGTGQKRLSSKPDIYPGHRDFGPSTEIFQPRCPARTSQKTVSSSPETHIYIQTFYNHTVQFTYIQQPITHMLIHKTMACYVANSTSLKNEIWKIRHSKKKKKSLNPVI